MKPKFHLFTLLFPTLLAAAGDGPGPTWDDRTPKPSQEWKKLPTQNWEISKSKRTMRVDRDGFDSKSLVVQKVASGFNLPILLVEGELVTVGSITAANIKHTHLTLKTDVTFESDHPFDKSRLYALVHKQMQIKNRGSSVQVYEVVGQLQILNQEGTSVLGRLAQEDLPVERNTLVVDFPLRAESLPPIPGKSAVKGNIALYKPQSTFLTSQARWILFDRGASDGVEPGMVIRIYQKQDPLTRKPFTPPFVFVEADAEIYHVSPSQSLAYVIRSKQEISDGSEAVLLTDVSELVNKYRFNQPTPALAVRTPTQPRPRVEEKPKPLPPLPIQKAPTPPAAVVSAPVPLPPEEDLPVTPAPKEALKEKNVSTPDPLILTDPALSAIPPKNPEPTPNLQSKLDSTEDKLKEDQDWLDGLDNQQSLSDKEKTEIEQLEKYATKPGQTEIPASTAAVEPPEEALPPPPPLDMEEGLSLDEPVDSSPNSLQGKSSAPSQQFPPPPPASELL